MEYYILIVGRGLISLLFAAVCVIALLLFIRSYKKFVFTDIIAALRPSAVKGKWALALATVFFCIIYGLITAVNMSRTAAVSIALTYPEASQGLNPNGSRYNMSNILTPFKKFFKNKNTVTIMCIFLGVLTLVIGYNYRVSIATDLVSVPYALKEIPKKTQITKDMIGHVKVPASLISAADNIITSDQELINYYSSYSTSIPAKSLFYKEVILEEQEMPDYAFMSMQDGYTVYSLKVNNNSTYSNRLRPGDYIDLYMQAKDNGKVIMGLLVKSIRIKAVKDSGGNSLLENTISGGTPAAMLFEVEDSLFDLLKKSEYVSDVEIIPVPRNANYTKEEGATMVSSSELTSYILNKCANID